MSQNIAYMLRRLRSIGLTIKKAGGYYQVFRGAYHVGTFRDIAAVYRVYCSPPRYERRYNRSYRGFNPYR